MTIKSVSDYLSSGIDEAIVSFVKGMLRFAAAASILYAAKTVEGLNPSTPELVIAVGIIDRALKSAWIYFTATSPVVPSTTTVDTVPGFAAVDGPVA